MSIGELCGKNSSRRELLKNLCYGAAVTSSAMILPKPVQAANFSFFKNKDYEASFRNQHTGESFSGVYRVGDKYLPEAFTEINRVLRDFRTNEEFPIDPRVIDILHMIQKNSDHNGAFEILSGYRSPKTNKMLSRATVGVAKNSLHLTGQAIDLRLPGYSTRKVQRIAKNLRAGGVGYYPKSNFVHVDTGQIRHW